MFSEQYPFATVNVVEHRSQIWRVLESTYRPQLQLWEHTNQNVNTHPDLYCKTIETKTMPRERIYVNNFISE